MVVAGAGERRDGSCYLMGTEFQFYKTKNTMDVDDGDGCTTLIINFFNTIELYI